MKFFPLFGSEKISKKFHMHIIYVVDNSKMSTIIIQNIDV